MKTINHLFGFLFLLLIGVGNSYSAGSTVVYPEFLHFGTATIDGTTTGVAKGGNVFQSLVSMPSNRTPGLQTSLNNAIKLTAPVSQTLAKKVFIRAVTGGVVGLGATYLASLGLEYLQGQWSGTIQSATWCVNGYCAQTATAACAAYYTPYTDFPSPGYSCNATGDASITTETGPNCCQAHSYGGGGITIRGHVPTMQSAPVSGPITHEQAEQIAESSPITPSDSDYQMMLDAGWAVPIQPNPEVVLDLANLSASDLQALQDYGYFQPTSDSIAIKNGQPVTDPLTGEKSQPMIQVEPAPNQGVRLTPYQTPLDANGQPATDAQGNPLPPTQAQFDPCELNPDRAGCANLGTPEETEIESEQRTVTGQFNEFNISGQCPADKSFTVAGMTHTIQMAPICGAAQDYIKPFLLLMASVTAYFIFVGGLRT